jgi:hypothetical protein
MDEGAKFCPVRVQIRGFLMKLWFFHEFARLLEPFGQVLALNPATAEHTDFRVARVRVGLCDAIQLPPLQWIMYYDPNAFWTRYDVGMKVKQGPVTSSGGLGNDIVKGKGKWQPYGSTSTDTQPAAKRNNNGDKKMIAGSVPAQECSEEYEIFDNGDLVLLPQQSEPPHSDLDLSSRVPPPVPLDKSLSPRVELVLTDGQMSPVNALPQEKLDSSVPDLVEVLETVPEKDCNQVVNDTSPSELPLIQSQSHSPVLLISPD